MIVSCPECSQKLRVPDGRQSIRVTCSTCGHRWDVQDGESGGALAIAADGMPAQKTIERAEGPSGRAKTEPDRKEVMFRCAKSGGQFKAIFKRSGTAGRFIFDKAHKIEGGTVSQSQGAEKSAARRGGAEAQSDDIDIEALDFGGWYCPHCGHDGDTIFVKCGRCRELVCGARVKTKFLSRKKIFECHDGCGRKGEINSDIDRISARALRQHKSSAPAKTASEGAQIENKPSLRLPKR
jgi:ribosomal protein S27E